ncbi:MAG: adenylate kinase [Sporichthyaceae bacterium]|jgi:adenylate kinase
MRILMVGPPGAGKGTQAVRIAEHFGLTHISSGDLLRKHVAEETGVGQKVQEYLTAGDLVPDAIVLDILRKPIVAASAAGGYVLDGFPRTVGQSEAGYAVAKELGTAVQVVVHLAVPREELIRRMLARGAQSGRSDDNLQVIEHRIDVYDSLTVPLLDYYRERETVLDFDGAQPMDEVTAAVIAKLEELRPVLDG